MPKRRLAAIVFGLLLTAQPAFAHAAFGTMGPFWSGVLHVLVSPLSLATIVGLGAALAPIPRGASALEIVIAVASAALAAWLLTAWGKFAVVGAIATGLTAALALKPTRIVVLTMSFAAGLSIGSATGLDAPSPTGGLGVALVVFLTVGAVTASFQELEMRLPLARRIAGAWVAAIALLIGALYLRG